MGFCLSWFEWPKGYFAVLANMLFAVSAHLNQSINLGWKANLGIDRPSSCCMASDCRFTAFSEGCHHYRTRCERLRKPHAAYQIPGFRRRCKIVSPCAQTQRLLLAKLFALTEVLRRGMRHGKAIALHILQVCKSNTGVLVPALPQRSLALRVSLFS